MVNPLKLPPLQLSSTAKSTSGDSGFNSFGDFIVGGGAASNFGRITNSLLPFVLIGFFGVFLLRFLKKR